MYRLIVSDYDGTLVKNDGALSQALFSKLNMLSSRGGIFAIASGRPYNQLKKLFYQSANSMVFISDDGAQMMYRNCLLYKKTLEMAEAKALCACAIENDIVAICALREENKRVTKAQIELPFFLSSDIFKIIIIKEGKDVSCIKQKAQCLKMRVCYEDGEYLEFCHKDANKADAVRKLMEKFSITQDKMLVIGDGVNDLGMLSLTQNRVHPADAKPEVIALGGIAVDNVEEFIIGLK